MVPERFFIFSYLRQRFCCNKEQVRIRTHFQNKVFFNFIFLRTGTGAVGLVTLLFVPQIAKPVKKILYICITFKIFLNIKANKQNISKKLFLHITFREEFQQISEALYANLNYYLSRLPSNSQKRIFNILHLC